MRQVTIVIPNYATVDTDLKVIEVMLTSLRRFEPEVRTIVVDDGSPADEIRRLLRELTSRFQAELIVKEENEGFSKTVNTGMRMAMADGMDVILANADLQFRAPFVSEMASQQRLDGGGPAEVVGALLVYPQHGLIQHAGQYLSLLTRTFNHVYQYAPEDLPEAQVAAVRPVTHALALIRHEALTGVGMFDEDFRLGHEDVDFNVRVLRAGGQCVYQPAVRAWHFESLFRGRESEKLARWHAESWARFHSKWGRENLASWVPAI